MAAWSKRIKRRGLRASKRFYKFYVKKKTTKKGRAEFIRKKVRIRIRIITWDMASSPSLNCAKLRMVESEAEILQEKFPEHEIVAVQMQNQDEVFLICKGKEIEDDEEDTIELIPSPYGMALRGIVDGHPLNGMIDDLHRGN